MDVSKIVNAALKQLGVLAAGENADAEEAADAVDSLKDLLMQWSTDRLYIHKVVMVDLPLSRGKGTYRIGKLEGDCCEYEFICPCASNCDDEPSYPEPMYKIPDLTTELHSISDTAWLDDCEFRIYRDTTQTMRHPKVIYSVDSPYWTFDVKEDAKSLRIKAYTIASDLCFHDELHLPAVYERALKLSLALEIAPMYGVEPSALLLQNQRSAISTLKNANSTPYYAKNDFPIGVGRHGCY